ncbi:alpha/beta hydrolase [Streptomyces kanamyceticus]|uniref:alpha/beta hydrolase n=1 Tax=Streptomyces kanamyceticus TaxID=1967 RepID=UPI0037DD6D14
MSAQTDKVWIETYEHIAGAPAAGPAEVQQVGVLKVGNADARRVLVLLGGREGGANLFLHTARSLAKASEDLQVWAVDRREQNLADLSTFSGDLEHATEYYLDGHYQAVTGTDAPYAAEWGLSVLVNDVREVVRQAAAGGEREVVLGGVSVGATAVLAYAAWDFDGTPGYSELAGLAVVDGGVHNAFAGAGMEFDLPLEAAKGWQSQIQGDAIFENFTSTATGLGERPESAAVWFQLAARYAVEDPEGISPLADRLPEALRPDRKVTNAALLGWLFDAERRIPPYAVHAGSLDDSGSWTDGGPTRLATVAEAFAGPERSSWLWYTLNRVMLDYVAAMDLAETDVTRHLGLRLAHGKDIDVPLYAFQSGMTGGTVGQAAATVAAGSRIPEVSVHSDFALAHQDVVYAQWEDNRFLQTLSGFLGNLPRRSPRG